MTDNEESKSTELDEIMIQPEIKAEPDNNVNSPVISKQKKSITIPKPFPNYNLEESLVIIRTIKQFNAGNPWTGDDIAKAMGRFSAKSNDFFYLTQASRDYGLSIGTSKAKSIEISDLGREFLYAENSASERKSLQNAFLTVAIFKDVYEYYKGTNLPDMKFLQNTLEGRFKLDRSFHTDFYDIYQANCRILNSISSLEEVESSQNKTKNSASPIPSDSDNTDQKTTNQAFVIMPFSEKTGVYPIGFYEEVYKQLIVPAAEQAGFKVYTARKDGSDVIHTTIISQLIEAPLVIADLTEHNPNVLFELGFRVAEDKPVVLIKARGTSPLFDVDNMLRVLDYDPNLWKSTLEKDIPALAQHLLGAWKSRNSNFTYKRILSGK